MFVWVVQWKSGRISKIFIREEDAMYHYNKLKEAGIKMDYWEDGNLEVVKYILEM